ncbi:MAG: DNA polymerase III subunit alpha [Firmicutes bacterium]|uniref:DNA-directed DNA polymerase n=1 Tax=Candidatus Onthovivens merdipullorum TaxID=2840889 RepID=A0A9D9GXC0_9BACL|nr:DNA polymerase III subunit alpha [Candidatus Onthovivens merdipullorum]
MDFIPLHIYSGYSFLNSGILFKDLANDAIKKGYKILGLSDLNVLYGFPLFNKTLTSNSLTPIFGVDLYIDNNLFTLYVKSELGYQNLCYISTFLEKKGGFCNDFEEIKDYLGDLICVISSKKSKCFKTINDNLFKEFLFKIKNYFNDFYIGIEIYSQEDKTKASLIEEFASLYSIPLIAFPFIQYLNKGDELRVKILKAISKDTAIETIEGEVSSEYYLRTNEEYHLLYKESYINELSNLVKKINFNFSIKRGELLHYTENLNISSKDLLKNKILKSLKAHNIDLNKETKYRNRLNKEFLIIDKMGYCDYFLIVQDYVNYAKDRDIPIGPGRGSAAGSLIAYLLGITEVDPLKFSDLLFERFLNPERKSMPDIDIDFSDLRRDEVINYIISKYGRNRTARVIAFQTIGAKQALRDVGRVFHYPTSDIDQLSKAIPNNFKQGKYTLDDCLVIPAFNNLIKDEHNKEIFLKAKMIEGFPRQKGLHAAGVIINNKSLLTSLPLTILDENTYVTQYEKDYLEEQGFLKMDLLGLTALSTIDNTLKLIKKYKNIDLKMSDIPFDDQDALTLIRENKTMGIFQLDTGPASRGISYIKPTSFNDIVDLLALDRPGPSEQIPLYSARKEGKLKINYLDNSLIPILKNTYGIIVYQEQIMQIARVFAGFSLSEADIFRRAISKKHLNDLENIKEKFFKGAIKQGHKKETISQIFDLILKFASYGFNKSHSVAYAMISTRMAYLKAHYPLEYYCAILESQYGSNDLKFSKYITEIKRMKITILNPNINKSSLRFTICNDALLLPLLNISGFPSKVSISIIEERNKHGLFKDFLDFVIRMSYTKDKITELQLNKLIDAGCFDTFNINRATLKASTTDALQYASTCIYKEGNLLDDFGLSFNYTYKEENKEEKMEKEYEALGVLISDSPFSNLKINPKIKLTDFDKLIKDKECIIIGLISQVKTVQIKKGLHKGEIMAFVDIYNEVMDNITVTVFSELYTKLINILTKDQIILIRGKLEIDKNDKRSFLASNIVKAEDYSYE